MAMPFLRAFTDQMVAFVNKQEISGWDKKYPVPHELKQQVLEVKNLMESWKGRQIGNKVPIRCLHSDSFNQGWAGVDV